MLVHKDLFNQLLSLAVESIEYQNSKDDDIKWITVKGNHIPIKKGESQEEAIKNFFESKSGKTKKQKPTETKEFKEWFDGSKVVDKEGEPRVMYHGTKSNKKFKEFDKEKTNWFTSSESYAEAFKGEEGNIYKVYISIKNPVYIGDIDGEADERGLMSLSHNSGMPTEKLKKILSKSGGNKLWNITNSEEFKKEMIKKGFDGLEAVEGFGLKTFGAFYPSQIKSIKNKGSFDKNSSKINE